MPGPTTRCQPIVTTTWVGVTTIYATGTKEDFVARDDQAPAWLQKFRIGPMALATVQALVTVIVTKTPRNEPNVVRQVETA